MERPLAIANGEILCRLRDQNGKKLTTGGVKRTSMTSLAVQRSHNVHLLVPQPEYMFSRPWPRFFWRREARDACPKPDRGRKHVGFNTTGRLGQVEIFQSLIMRISRVDRAGTAFAN